MNIEQTKISEVVENFNFHKVKRVMRELNWTWAGASREPSYKQLIDEATSRLESAAAQLEYSDGKDIYHSESGGFKATAYYQTTGELCLTLEFVVTESQNF